MGATPRSCRDHCLKGLALKELFNQLNLTFGGSAESAAMGIWPRRLV